MIIFSISCQNSRNQKKQEAQNSQIKIGYIPIADCGQLYVGIEKGFFREENIEVELVKLSGGAKILEALAGGSVDIGFSNVISLILSNSAGLDFRAVTGGPVENLNHKETAIMVSNKSSINKPKDLEGLKIAVNTRKNIMEIMLIKYFEKHGLDYSSIKLSEVPFPNMEQVLTLNQVDAIATIEPFVTFAKENGNSKVFSHYFTDVDSIIEISSYNASEKYINNNPDVINAFQKAIQKSTEYAINHEEEMKEIVSKYTNLSVEQLTNVVLPTFTHDLSVQRLQDFCDKVYELKWSDNLVDAKSIIMQ
jgi:NitT/TauT family transport system substrate-binding protein